MNKVDDTYLKALVKEYQETTIAVLDKLNEFRDKYWLEGETVGHALNKEPALQAALWHLADANHYINQMGMFKPYKEPKPTKSSQKDKGES